MHHSHTSIDGRSSPQNKGKRQWIAGHRGLVSQSGKSCMSVGQQYWAANLQFLSNRELKRPTTGISIDTPRASVPFSCNE